MNLDQFLSWALLLLHDPFSFELWAAISMFIPFVLFFELPVYLLILVGIAARWVEGQAQPSVPYTPPVSCIVACYAEGRIVQGILRCLAEQIYEGEIEILAVVDGATANPETLAAAREMQAVVAALPRRRLVVVPKWQRGGRVSVLNAGLSLAHGQIVMVHDADTSFDNDMVAKSVRYFADPKVMAVAGALRVRNAGASIIARLQALEYLLSIHAGKTGLSAFNVVNNISGAFGIFRTSALRRIGGWDTGTAEDLDATLRLKAYLGRHPDLRILFAPDAVGHTDVPETLVGFFKQRIRWDGDLAYIYLRKHRASFNSRILGWRNFLMQAWTGIMFQVFTPVLIVTYMTWLCWRLPLSRLLVLFGAIYVFYFAISCLLFCAFVFLVSERRCEDLRLLPWLPLFAVFTFCSRCVSACAVLWELVGKGHLDSSMAPWWVLKKGKY